MDRNRTTYGAGVLREAIAPLERAVVVTDAIPWRMHRQEFSSIDVHEVMPGSLERSELDDIAGGLPPGAPIVGLGGGAVIDASKYFARERRSEPVLVPTITSSNAPFSDFISVRSGGRPTGMKGEETVRRIIVDYDLIRKAEPRLNRAGFGDLLSIATSLADWRIAAARGWTVPVDPLLADELDQAMDLAMASAGEVRRVSDRGIETLMRLFERTTNLLMRNLDKPVSAGSEHLFAWHLEGVTGRHFLHGEVVALGVVISSHLQDPGSTELREALDDAGVRYRPQELDLEWPDVERTLATVHAYNEEVRNFRTVFDTVEWTPERLKEIHDLLY